MANEKIAIILVRGLVGVRQDVKDTLSMLGLTRKNHCVVIPNNPINVKDLFRKNNLFLEKDIELINGY